MKTKEEILKKATKGTLNINEGSPLHDAVMKAMEEYAQQQVKNCSMPAVVGQSEQLVCECKDEWIEHIDNFSNRMQCKKCGKSF